MNKTPQLFLTTSLYIRQLYDAVRQIFLIIKYHYKLKPNQIITSLSQFYTQSVDKRTQTRKRDRPEFELIVSEIKKSKSDISKLYILELGCGDGRFAEYLDEHLGIPFNYMGVDCSHGLIKYAQSRTFDNGNEIQFMVGDMVQCLSLLEQQSVDIVVGIASIQHLHFSLRAPLWAQIYRILQYDGLLITTNWSYSQWMFKKHLLQSGAFIAGLVLQLINHKTFGWGDYIIPFKEAKTLKGEKAKTELWKHYNIDNKQQTTPNSQLLTSYRFYHIFLLGSLIQYARSTGFMAQKACYVSSVGQLSDNWRTSRNTFLVAKKDICTS